MRFFFLGHRLTRDRITNCISETDIWDLAMVILFHWLCWHFLKSVNCYLYFPRGFTKEHSWITCKLLCGTYLDQLNPFLNSVLSLSRLDYKEKCTNFQWITHADNNNYVIWPFYVRVCVFFYDPAPMWRERPGHAQSHTHLNFITNQPSELLETVWNNTSNMFFSSGY